MAVADKEKMYMLGFFVLGIGFLATLIYLAQLGTVKYIYIERPTGVQQVTPTPAPVPAPAPAKTYPETKLLVYVRDVEGNRLANTTVQLWTVYNMSAVLDKAFYTTEGYSIFDTATTDERGRAEFTISAMDYMTEVLAEEGVKLYAVVLPNESVYYRAGVEVPELEMKEGEFTKAYYSVKVEVPKIAQYYDLYNPVVDIRGLKAEDTKEKDYKILSVSENEKGVLKVYKLVLIPGALTNMTDQFDYLTIKVGETEVELIKDGEVKLTENKEVEFPVKELKAGESLSITVSLKLAADADPNLDGMKVVDIQIVDVRDQAVGTVSITLDTA